MKMGLNSRWAPWATLIKVLLLPTLIFCVCKIGLIPFTLLSVRALIKVFEEALGSPRPGSGFLPYLSRHPSRPGPAAAAGCRPTSLLSPRSGFVNIPINNTAT